ncbi:MAG: copper amine oxidase N-terminal domain-containing protein [Bacillota bacterium]
MKKTIIIAVILITVLGFAVIANAGTTLTLDKSSFLPGPGQKVKVYFATDYPISDDAWIGVIPAGVPHGPEKEGDDQDLSYQWASEAKYDSSGKKYVEIDVPDTAGEYTVRMYSSADETQGTELASTPLTVSFTATPATTTTGTAAPAAGGSQTGTAIPAAGGTTNLTLDRATFLPGPEQKVKVYFTTDYPLFDDAWIGVIPAGVPHGPEKEGDDQDINYQWVSDAKYDSSGKKYVELNVPEAAGNYTVRMYSSDDETKGIELAFTPLTVSTSAVPAAASQANAGSNTVTVTNYVTVLVNGQPLQSDVRPFVNADGRTMLPVRAVAEALGSQVQWDESTQTATLIQGNNIVQVPVGRMNIIVGGKTVPIDTASVIKDGRTLLPVRPIAEALGVKIGWDAATSTVKIEKNQ